LAQLDIVGVRGSWGRTTRFAFRDSRIRVRAFAHAVRIDPIIALFCFADGHALPLSTSIDIGVYMRAISPADSLYGQPVDGDVR
jgi:hypothetical protein